MAALGTELVTLADVAKSKNKEVGKVAEVLIEFNPMLQDIPYMQMNELTIHKEDIRSGLPAVFYRKANEAIPASKTTVEERTFNHAHFESKSQMDFKVASRGGTDRIGYNRWNQAQGHIQAQALEHADLIIHGSPVSSNLKVAGFYDIYSTLATSEESSKQIIDGGGTGSDNTSILLVHWGFQSIFGVYPAGTQMGLKRTDRSQGDKQVQITALDSNGNTGTFWGFEEQFEIDHGLVVKDFRQAARIANLDVSDLKSGTGAADLIDLMISAKYLIAVPSNGRGVWYVNSTIEAFLHKQALTAVGAGAGIRYDNFEGKKILMFLDMPVRRSDAILNNESQITT